MHDEISLSDAREFEPNCDVGDKLQISINPQTFDRISVQSAKQKSQTGTQGNSEQHHLR